MKLRQYQVEAKTAVINSKLGQVIAPTGTGKSVIQGAVFESLINGCKGFGIYVILTPRILLTNQLMKDVGSHLISNGIEIKALTIHSGKAAEFEDESEDDYTSMLYAQVGNHSTTRMDVVITAFEDAKFENKPILICCTYDSVPTLTRALIESGLSAKQVLCDEAHYIVEKKFNQNVDKLKPFVDSMHFFTATQKNTVGDFGNGMNNQSFYGPVVFRRAPRQMIDEGFMVRPRIHYELAEENAAWSRMVADAFTEHQLHVSYNAKMLVCCNGTKTIKEIADSPGFKEWCKEQGITLFAVSSAHGATIDGVKVERDPFLKKMKACTGKAIILHINILTEGIDIPDITGVMFIRNMGTTRFLQSVGRATRVLSVDLGKSTDEFEINAKLWIKPYAWVIIAERDGDNEGKTSGLRKMVENMRMAGFEPTEDVVIAVDRAKKVKEEIIPCNEKDAKIISTFKDLFDIQHSIELEKLAAMTNDELFAAVPI